MFSISYSLSAKQFGESDRWTNEQLKALANKAITNWGPSGLWEKAQVSELGNIVGKIYFFTNFVTDIIFNTPDNSRHLREICYKNSL